MRTQSGLDRGLQNSSEHPDRQGPPLLHRRRSPAANALQVTIVSIYPVVLTLVLTPVILHYIGAAQYGIYALAMVFVSFVGLIDIGMGPAVVRFLSASLATSDYEEARLVLGVGAVLFSAVGLLGAVLAFVGGHLLPHFFSLSPDLRGTATFVISVAGVGFFFDSLRAPFASLPGALQRFDSITYASLIATTTGAVATVVVLALGWGVRGLIIVATLQSALTLVLIARSNRRLMPSLPIHPIFDRLLLKKMVSFSAYSFVSNTASVVLFQMDKFVLGVLTSVSLVTYYVVPGNVAQRLHVTASSLAAVALAVSADLSARRDRTALNAFYVRATRTITLVIVSLAVPAFVLARQLMLEWVGPTFASTSFGTLRLLLLTYAALALTALPYYIVLGIGQPRIMAAFNVVAAALNLGLIVILVPRYGLIGAAIAYCASTVTVPLLIYYVERRLLELDRSPWPSLALRLCPVVAGQAVCCLLLRPLATGLGQVIGIALLGIAAGPTFAWTMGYLTPEDRRTVTRLAARIRPRREQAAESTTK